MPPKGSKALKRKQSLIGQFSSNKKRISTLEQTLSGQEKLINKLEHRLNRRKERASLVLSEIGKSVRSDFNTRVKLVPIVMAVAAAKRQTNLANDSLNYKSTQRRRDETLRAAAAVHGAANDLSTALDGLVDTVLGKFKAIEVVEKIFNSKKSVSNAIIKKRETSICSDYYKSNNNLLRSLNI